MERVKLPREVAEAVRNADEDQSRTLAEIVEHHIVHRFYRDLEPLNTIDTDTLIRALYIGYEVEQTPEEKAIAWMLKNACLRTGYSAHDVVMAIKSILNNGE